VVILQTEIHGKNRIMGVVVDAVSNVIDIDKTTIQSPPEFGTKVSTEYINGLAAVDEQMLMLLDVDKLLKLEGMDDEDEI
jgi:purine-binding chemotaxis protein CheW